MKHTEEGKKRILSNYLEIISDISDKGYQNRVWIRGEGPEYDSYDEAVCHFFDDGDHILENYQHYNITYKQYQILKAFRNEFRYFEDNIEINYAVPEEFIDTPEWAKIMESAKKVLKAFDYKKDE